MFRTSMLSCRLSGLLATLSGALVMAALAACADSGPEPATPHKGSPEGPTGTSAVPYTAAPEAPAAPTAATAAPTAAPTAPAATGVTIATATPASPSFTATPQATGAVTAGPAASAEPAAEIDLEIRLRDAKKEGGKLIYDVDSSRMVATHRVYELDAAELEKALGKKKDAKSAKLKLSCGPASSRTSAGAPGGAQPVGGFVYMTQVCKVVKVLSAD